MREDIGQLKSQHKAALTMLDAVAHLITEWKQYVLEIEGSTGEVAGVEKCIEDLYAVLTKVPAPTFDHAPLKLNYEEAKAFVDGVVADLKARREAALKAESAYWRMGMEDNDD